MSLTTIYGHRIDINEMTEWLLFNRLINKLHPVDILRLTDAFIQFPNFLYTLSILTLLFVDTDLWIKLAIPTGLYFFGQMLINLRFGNFILKLLKYPLLFFSSANQIVMVGTFITCFFYIGMWTFFLIPVYLFTKIISVIILTSSEKKYYKSQWQKSTGNYDIFKNNAFLVAYKYFAKKYGLILDTTPTDEEINNLDWLKPFDYMRSHWAQMEKYFNKKAKMYWRAYLKLDK